MTTNNHPANGPVSLERLHQIREILSKAAEQSDGGNLGYAMADAVKVIDGVIASSGMKPYGYVHKGIYESCGTSGLSNDHEAYCSSNTHIALYTAPPATVVPPEKTDSDYVTDCHGVPSLEDCAHQRGWNACRAAMLQAEPVSNSDELPLDYLQGHKDGLELAAQLAEANHPQTGDWLYDDPIDLARAIRKGPDMPTVQGGNSPVIPDGWVMVPVELTPDMRAAWDSAPYTDDDDNDMQAAYRAMIAAAPQWKVK